MIGCETVCTLCLCLKPWKPFLLLHCKNLYRMFQTPCVIVMVSEVDDVYSMFSKPKAYSTLHAQPVATQHLGNNMETVHI